MNLDPTISVITATFNAGKHLPRLINSLEKQTDRDFQWIIADGKSDDNTLDLLNNSTIANKIITSEKDCGIYDALNRAVNLCKTDYYIVMGADDMLYENTISEFRHLIADGSIDLVAAAVKVGDKIWQPKIKYGWLYGMAGVASSHSVGLMIKTDLHEKYGLYDNFLKITADQLFIKSTLNGGASIIRANFISGELNLTGFSSENELKFITEYFISQLKTEKYKFLQIILLFLRIIKNFKKL